MKKEKRKLAGRREKGLPGVNGGSCERAVTGNHSHIQCYQARLIVLFFVPFS